MVRLRDKILILEEKIKSSFNSKMVRLRDDKVSKRGIWFVFQFQNGAIKRKSGEFNTLTPESFNSKMVRLREDIADIFLNTNKFQFQNGAIKSWCFWFFVNSQFCFNSKMVRLRESQTWPFFRLKKVSIPKWCD